MSDESIDPHDGKSNWDIAVDYNESKPQNELSSAHGSETVLVAKVEALEKLVIELTLIAISTATIKHHHKARLDHLLGELQYAGESGVKQY